MKKSLVLLIALVFLFSGRFALAADYKYDKTVLLYQDKIKKIEIKHIDDFFNGYQLFVNNKKVKLNNSLDGVVSVNELPEYFNFKADRVKFYTTDKSNLFVFAYTVNSGIGFVWNYWLFFNLNTDGSVDLGPGLRESYDQYEKAFTLSCKNSSDISFQNSAKGAKTTGGPIELDVRDNIDAADCVKYKDSKSSADLVRIVNQPKFLGFDISYYKDSLLSLKSYKYLEKSSMMLICSAKDNDKFQISNVCRTQKKVLGVSPDLAKFYFTADSDYMSGSKIKNWKESYSLNLKTGKITKEKIGKTIKIKFVKDLNLK